MSDYLLNQGHFVFDGYRQVVTTKEWREFVKHHERWIFFRGEIRPLMVHSIGAGMLEVSKGAAND